MSAEFDTIQRAIDANRSLAFPQYPLTVGTPNDIGEPQQPQLMPDNGSGSAISSSGVAHPFRVTTRVMPESDPATYQFIVELESNVLTNIYPMTEATIVGLAATAIPATDDPAWKTLDPADTIYIEWDVVEDTYTIDSIGNGGDWDLTEGVTYDGVDQTFANAVIATTIDEDGVPRLIQKVHGDLVMAQWAVEGRVATVFMLHTGAA